MLQLAPEASGAPNALAILTLLAWPLVVLAAYSVSRSSDRIARTTAWMMTIPVMFLPANLTLKLPGVPALTKHRIAFLSIAVCLALFDRRPREPGRERWFLRLVFLGLVLGSVQTVLTNQDALRFGNRVLPALTYHDAISLSLGLFVDVFLPFAVGQRAFRNERHLRELFDVLGRCALIYLPLCLFEVRFSPQLHRWVYGYHQFQFLQSVRAGGYRPAVFMNHGLSVAMFLFSCFCASLGLAEAGVKVRPSTRARISLTGLLLLLSKSWGAIIYAAVALLLQLRLSSKALGRVLVVATVLVLAYPSVRAANAFPTREVGTFFSNLSMDRAQSLLFRFENEDSLLAHARERPVFGWGSWGRNRLYHESGQDASVPDGLWIILIGVFGYLGFAGFFAIMTVPVLRFVRNRSQMPDSSQILVGALALMVSMFTLDFLPNSQSDLLPLAYAGALYGLSAPRQRQFQRRHNASVPRVAWSAEGDEPAHGQAEA